MRPGFDEPISRGAEPRYIELFDDEWVSPGHVPEPPRRPRRLRPLVLYVATFFSTWFVADWIYALSVMTILTAHELGHYFQARRYGVPASFPYFIPMPISPIGTMGAVIVMQPGIAHRRALFDLAISGPIAGLLPALAASWVGLGLSTVAPTDQLARHLCGEPIVFSFLSRLRLGVLPAGYGVDFHPLAFAGWVGIFITALNMLPIGQLDGGHILYALLPRRARRVSILLFLAAAVAITFNFQQYKGWSLMMILLAVFGVAHPPTANDRVPLGTGRIILGWLMLAFLVVGFTPTPFRF